MFSVSWLFHFAECVYCEKGFIEFCTLIYYFYIIVYFYFILAVTIFVLLLVQLLLLVWVAVYIIK